MLAILVSVAIFIIAIAFGFMVNAGIVWVLTWALVKAGITTIFGWTVAFSWPLVVIFTIVYAILRAIFVNKE